MIGHILPGIGPDDMGRLRPSDLLGAAELFDAKYQPVEDD